MKNQKEQQKLKFFEQSSYFNQFTTHISEETIITKNTHLLQTIKINSLYCNFADKEVYTSLTDEIRKSIKQHVKSLEFSFWIHTIRRKANFNNFYHSQEEMSNNIFQEWSSHYKLDSQFINELYITIILQGIEVQNSDITLKSFSHKKIKNTLTNKIEIKEKDLNQVSNAILKDLQPYQATKLKIVEEDGVMYSQNIEFLHKITNLVDIKNEVQESDISNLLNISKYKLDDSILTISNEFGEHCISSLTLKQYYETNLSNINNILTLPFEFFIYQTFNFTNIDKVLSKSYVQYKVLKISQDEKLMNLLQLTNEEFENLENEKGKDTLLYGESQIGIILIGKNQADLVNNLYKLHNVLKETGFVFAKEDVDLEASFYASIPANFYFLKRLQPIPTNKIAGFSGIDCYQSGKCNQNKWGESIAIFETANNKTPYFFNLHNQNGTGHTIVLGTSNNIYQHAILHFIILNTFKFDTRVLIIDSHSNAKLFSAFIGGKYLDINLINNIKKEEFFQSNPATLLTNKVSLYKIAKESLKLQGHFTKQNVEYLKKTLIPFVLSNANKITDLESFENVINNNNTLNTFFKPIIKGGSLHAFFTSKEQDEVTNLKAGDFLAINIANVSKNENEIHFMFKYVLEQISLMVKDKQKTIIKIDYFLWHTFNNHFTKQEIKNFLTHLTQCNALLVIMEEYKLFENYHKTDGDKEIFDLFQNQIFISPFTDMENESSRPSSHYLEDVSQVIPIQSKQKKIISDFAYSEEVFVLKYGEHAIPLEFNEKFSDFYFFFLSNSIVEDYFLDTLNAAKTNKDRIMEARSIYKILFNQNEKQ